MKSKRITPIIWAYAALALMAGLASTGANANTITMEDYGSVDDVICVQGCMGFVGPYPNGPISLSSTDAHAYPQGTNPESEMDRLNELLGWFDPPRDPVTHYEDPDGGTAGDSFETNLQYFAIKKANNLWYFENTSGGLLEVMLAEGAETYSHWTAFGDPVSPVPVPAAVWLFGTALVGFIGISRRTKVA